MKIKVHMLAFNDKGTVRYVDIPNEELTLLDDPTSVTYIPTLLELVFRYGQNDFQPQQITSVSVGDVIELCEEFWTVAGCGFKKITSDEFDKLPGNLSQNINSYLELMKDD